MTILSVESLVKTYPGMRKAPPVEVVKKDILSACPLTGTALVTYGRSPAPERSCFRASIPPAFAGLSSTDRS